MMNFVDQKIEKKYKIQGRNNITYIVRFFKINNLKYKFKKAP